MRTYYVPTTPESIPDLLKSGKFPEKMPNWGDPKRLVCLNKPQESLSFCGTTTPHQIFILQIEDPARLPLSQEDPQVLQQIDPRRIKKAIVYSERGKKLLQRLLGENSTLPIEINSELYRLKEEAPVALPSPSFQIAAENKRKKEKRGGYQE